MPPRAEDSALWLHELIESIRADETEAPEEVADFLDGVLANHAERLAARLIEDALGVPNPEASGRGS